MPQRTDIPHQRLSASQLPPEVEPAERDFMRLLERALAPSYTLVKRLGAGGMGAVYLARDPVLKRLVAVKVMAPGLAADPAARARFEREAQAVASISHPNVVSVYTVGELENGVPFLVMQYVEGRTMAERLAQDGPLEVRSANRVLGEVASALAAAHRKGIIHRDIKPANILLDDDTGRAMVTDFGIAAVRERGDERDAVRITHTGMAIGTPAYMSPEQLLAEPVTEKTDIYSLGLLGYELFIGEGPYAISSPRELMAAHLRDTPRKLSAMRADIHPELARLLESCLAKEASKRPNAAEVETRLAHGASVLLEWPPPGLEHLADKHRDAVRLLLIGGFATAVPIVAVSVFDRDSLVRHSLPPTLAITAFAAVGLLLFAVGITGVGRFLRAAQKAVGLGYGWWTVLEVAADDRGDTGAIITGGREYAELAPETRGTMRRLRLVAAASRVAAGVAPVVGFVIGVLVVARSSIGPTIVLWASLLLSLTLLAVSRAVAWQEERTLRPARARLRTASVRTEGLSRLAETWTTAFEQVRAGQSLGAGTTKHRRLIFGAATAVFTLAALAGIGLFMILSLTTIVETLASTAVPRFGAMRAKIARVQRLSPYRVAPDTAISALRAGQALHAIIRNGPGGRPNEYEKTPAISIPPQPRTGNPRDPFGAADGGWSRQAFRQAPRGFSADQRDFLRAMADNSALEEFRVLARAPSVDLAAAYLDIKPGTEPMWYALPVPKYTFVKTAANANAAQAALDFAAGRRQDAERRLRENISVGFHMMREGRVMNENFVGANIVAGARESLVALFELTGRAPEARSLSADADPVITVVEQSTRPSVDEINRLLGRIVLDEQEPLGLRWEMLASLAWVPCSDMHQVLFGPDALHASTLAAARKSLVRRSSDSLLFAVIVQSSDLAPERSRRQPAAARVLSALTGNRQAGECLWLLGLRRIL